MRPVRREDEDARRYARHLSLTGFGADGQEWLRRARVLVVGAGGLGSPVISYLAGCGIGRLVVVDPDVVELSNLPRQVIHDERSLGMAKVDSAARVVARHNSGVEIVPVAESLDVALALDLVAAADVVVDCSDSVEVRYVLNDACVLLEVPLVWASISEYEGQFGVVDPGVGPCYRCVFPDPSALRGAATCEQAGVLGVLPGVIGTLQAVEVVKALAALDGVARDAIRLYDALAASLTRIPVTRDPACRVCATGEAYFDGVDDQSAPVGGAGGDGERDGMREIDLHERPRERYVVVDVRGHDEAAGEALPADLVGPAEEVRIVPWGQGWDAAAVAAVDDWVGQRDAVLVCARGLRSRSAAALLATMGAGRSDGGESSTSHVMSLRGGLAGLRGRALP